MEISRRNFIQKMALLGLSAQPLLQVATASTQEEPLITEGEAYWKTIRDQFPITKQKAYFNNGALGPSPLSVSMAVRNGLDEIDRVGELPESNHTRTKLAVFVGASPDEISFTHNTTEGINIVVWGLDLKRGDEVIMTRHEHAGNAIPWIRRAQIDGIVLKTFEPALTAEENLFRIRSLITSRTCVIAVPHVTCTLGTILPVREISALGKAHGLFVMIDGAHGTGMMPLDLKKLDCDFYAACCHKWLCGPKGTGYLYVRKNLLDTLTARFVGAYSNPSYDLYSNPPSMGAINPTAHRYDYGTQNEALLNGVSTAIDFMNGIGMEKVFARGKELSQFFVEEIKRRSDRIQHLSTDEENSRSCITSFRIKDVPFDRFGMHARTQNIRIRQVAESGLKLLRVSTHVYNNFEDLNRLLSLIDTYR